MNIPQKIVRFFLIAMSLIIGGLVSLTCLLWFYEDELGDKIIVELRQSAGLDIELESNSFSFWQSLPYVSFDLEKVKLRDPKKASILEADVLGLRLSLKTLFKKQLQFENILIQDGFIRIHTDKKGNTNYAHLTESDSDQTAYFNSLSLDYCRLKNMVIKYEDEQSSISLNTRIDQARLDFINDDQALKLDLVGNGMMSELVQNESIFKNLDFDLALKLESTSSDKTLQLNTEKLVLFGSDCGLNYQSNENGSELNLQMNTTPLKNTLEFLNLSIENLSVVGEHNSVLRYKTNKWGKSSLIIDGRVSDAYVENKDGESKIEAITCGIHIEKPENKTFDELKISLDDIECTNKDLHFKSNLKIISLSHPQVKFDGHGTLSVSSILELLEYEDWKADRGILNIKDLSCSFSKTADSWSIESLKGLTDIDYLLLQKGKTVIDAPHLQLKLSKDLVHIDPAVLNLNEKPLKLKLSLDNLAQNVRKETIHFNAIIETESLSYDEIVEIIKSNGTKEASIDSIKAENNWAVIGDLSLKTEIFQYEETKLNNAEFTMDLAKETLSFNANGEAFKGSLFCKGRYSFDKEKMDLELVTKDVEISDLLKSFDNFDQEVIQDKNIKGKMESSSVIRVKWDENGQFLKDELEVYSDMHIKEGSLLGVTMLYGFSNIIKLRDLMEINFTNLKNYLEISDGYIYIPQMFIQSNAMNMTVAGEHSFDNQINYSFKINAGQLLMNKLKKYEGGRKPLPSKRNGMFNVYYNMSGDIKDYDIKANRSIVSRHFKETSIHKHIIYEELKRVYPLISNPALEPDEWLDFDSPNTLFSPSNQSSSEEEFLDGF